MENKNINQSSESELVDNQELRNLIESCSTCGW